MSIAITHTDAMVSPAQAGYVAPNGNLLVVQFYQVIPPPPPSDADFNACTSLAEMHRQQNYLAAQATFPDDRRLLRRAIQLADQQYFLDVLSCAAQFGRSVPSAEDGLFDIVTQLNRGGSD
jgi:hypothetical protein